MEKYKKELEESNKKLEKASGEANTNEKILKLEALVSQLKEQLAAKGETPINTEATEEAVPVEKQEVKLPAQTPHMVRLWSTIFGGGESVDESGGDAPPPPPDDESAPPPPPDNSDDAPPPPPDAPPPPDNGSDAAPDAPPPPDAPDAPPPPPDTTDAPSSGPKFKLLKGQKQRRIVAPRMEKIIGFAVKDTIFHGIQGSQLSQEVVSKLFGTFQEREKSTEEVEKSQEKAAQEAIQKQKLAEKLPRVIDSKRFMSVGILLKKNTVDVDALAQFIASGGGDMVHQVPLFFLEQIASEIVAPKKQPDKYDSEKQMLLSYDEATNGPLKPPEVFLKKLYMIPKFEKKLEQLLFFLRFNSILAEAEQVRYEVLDSFYNGCRTSKWSKNVSRKWKNRRNLKRLFRFELF